VPPENKIEDAVCAFAISVGMLSYKFVSPSNRGVPDRIFLYRGHAMFIEFKRTGKIALDPLQEVVGKKFAANGFIVQVCNDIQEGNSMILAFRDGVDNVKP